MSFNSLSTLPMKIFPGDDFEKVPIIMQPISALISYLECRGLSPKSSTTRDQINAAVDRVSSQHDSSAAIIPIMKDNARGVVVPGPRSRSYRIVLRYTTHRTLQLVVSS